MHPFFAESEHTLWPFRFPRFASPSVTSCSRVRSSDTYRPRQEIGQRTPEGIVPRPVRAEERKAHHGSGPQWITPRLPACRVSPESP